MIPERIKPNDRLAWEELNPALREAVCRVCNDPLPEAVARRALEAAARQIARLPDRPETRFLKWAAPVAAASILLLGITTGFWAVRTGRFVNSSSLPAPSVGAAQPNDNNLRTAGAYAQAARQSPEAVLTQMDRQSQRSQSGKPRPMINSSVFPFESTPGTAP